MIWNEIAFLALMIILGMNLTTVYLVYQIDDGL